MELSCKDLNPPDELVVKIRKDIPDYPAIHRENAIAIAAYSAGVEKGYLLCVERNHNLWPVPFDGAVKQPKKEDADCDGYVQIYYENVRAWAYVNWEYAAAHKLNWMHTPAYYDPYPTKKQGLEDLKMIKDSIAKGELSDKEIKALDRIKQLIEGIEE